MMMMMMMKMMMTMMMMMLLMLRVRMRDRVFFGNGHHEGEGLIPQTPQMDLRCLNNSRTEGPTSQSDYPRLHPLYDATCDYG